MSSTSVSAWLEELKEGESHAAEKLWRHYLHRLLGLARKKLGSRRSALADEDDAVNDAFADFLRGMEGRQFAKLDDRHDLWQVLVVLTERRVVDQIRHELAVKRGAGRMDAPGVGGADAALHRGQQDSISQVTNGEPTPAFATQAAEQLQILLAELPGEMREIAVKKLEGYTNPEIADSLQTSLRSVERRLGLIRRIWTERLPQ